MDRSRQIDTFCRFTQVSRETITSLNEYEKYLIKCNKKLNLVGKSTINNIWYRHFFDSSQAIDFIDKNTKNIVDLGSGAGFPAIVLALLAKDRGISLKIKLYEKSPKKSDFLIKVAKLLNLNIKVETKNVFLVEKFSTNILVARAFKPLLVVLNFIHKKVIKWEKLILFMGKNVKTELIKANKYWIIDFKEVKSISSDESKLLVIRSLKRK